MKLEIIYIVPALLSKPVSYLNTRNFLDSVVIYLFWRILFMTSRMGLTKGQYSWNPLGHSRPVTVLLYLYLFTLLF